MFCISWHSTVKISKISWMVGKRSHTISSSLIKMDAKCLTRKLGGPNNSIPIMLYWCKCGCNKIMIQCLTIWRPHPNRWISWWCQYAIHHWHPNPMATWGPVHMVSQVPMQVPLVLASPIMEEKFQVFEPQETIKIWLIIIKVISWLFYV